MARYALLCTHTYHRLAWLSTYRIPNELLRWTTVAKARPTRPALAASASAITTGMGRDFVEPLKVVHAVSGKASRVRTFALKTGTFGSLACLTNTS